MFSTSCDCDRYTSLCVCVCVCVCVHMHSFWGCCLSTFQLFHRPSEDGRPCTQAAKNSHRHQAQFVTQLPSSAGDRSGNLSANHRQHFSHWTLVLTLCISACLVKNVHWFATRAGNTEKYIVPLSLFIRQETEKYIVLPSLFIRLETLKCTLYYRVYSFGWKLTLKSTLYY